MQIGSYGLMANVVPEPLSWLLLTVALATFFATGWFTQRR
ncbi:MAG TPA: PEP-CTERM sorting domain-containing protein [Gaiellales bacterium]|nr:PEP-CTERM sorting domain-containing protein [Gaiellales bacterium]